MPDTLRSISGPNVNVRIATAGTPASILADRDQIARAIVGCVLNAREAMPDGGELTVETSGVDPELARQLAGVIGDRPYVGLAISDTGPTGHVGREGQGPSSGGTGLGLALVYSTVQLAGGRIRLESTPGHGSTVRILVPVAPPEDASIAGIAPSDGSAPPGGSALPEEATPRTAPANRISDAIHPPEPKVPGAARDPAGRVDDSGSTIVVVEDEPGVRLLLERVLIRGGQRVLAFPDGSSALDALADPAQTIDLLVTDLVMPGLNGIEVARGLRRDRPALRVILMSGYAVEALRDEGLDETSVDLLAKPFTAAELLERVAASLAAPHSVSD
ncbi:MAG: response regulator [Chloroflexi bacterium]|nr:response regulator [Chloroflexota bacterium]